MACCCTLLHCTILTAVMVSAPALLPPATAATNHDLILKPKPKPAGKPEAVFILITAPQMVPSRYLPLVKAVQTTCTHPLWVAVPEVDDAQAESDMAAAVARVMLNMTSQGLNKSSPVFFAAHSQTFGSLLQDYVASRSPSTSPRKAAGLILLGSFLKRSYRSSPYPVPTLTVGGELDGVCRVTRIMEEYFHRIHSAKNRDEAVVKFPVVSVRGMSHLQFASGEPSDIIRKYDLKPEIPATEATSSVSYTMASFIDVHMGNEASASAVESAVARTGVILSPLIDAYVLGGSYQLKPPCEEHPPSSECQVGSAWTEKAMSIMAALDPVKMNDTDAFHPASEVFPHIHHPRIFGSTCSSQNTSCVVSLSSVSQNIYYSDKADSGLVPNSACEIRAKLKSRQSVMLAAGFKNVDFNTSDAGSLCMKINQLAYDWALNHSSPTARKRFQAHGVPINMGQDKGSMHNGGLWIYLPMSYTQTQNSSGSDILLVSSIQLKTDVKYPIGMFQGMHFCKLLSPAKVMEWIYVDGLRARYSLSGNRAELMSCGL